MGLEQVVIVKPEQVANLYRVPNPERYFDVLQERGVLPLTVKSLTTDRGRALLHLATWVYFSGNLSGRDFVPTVSGSKDFLDYLVKQYLGECGAFRHEERTESNGSILLAENSGAIGRLIHAMGVPKPKKDSKRKSTKPDYGRTLPHYFTKIANAVPQDANETGEKKDLLYTLTKILFKDRFRVEYKGRKWGYAFYIELNNFKSDSSARKNGVEIIHFLNSAFPQEDKGVLFKKDSINVHFEGSKGLYRCRLWINEHQLNCMAANGLNLLGAKVPY